MMTFFLRDTSLLLCQRNFNAFSKIVTVNRGYFVHRGNFEHHGVTLYAFSKHIAIFSKHVFLLLLLFNQPFRGMGAWRKTMEPQKPGNSPGSGPEVVERRESSKSERCKESVAGQCRTR